MNDRSDGGARVETRARTRALRYAGVYVLAALVAVAGSEWLLQSMFDDPEQRLRAGQVLGLVFVLVSAVLLLVLLVHFDRGRRAQAEHVAAQADQYQRLFDDGAGPMLVVEDGDDTILEANRAAIALFEADPDAMVGQVYSRYEATAPDAFRESDRDPTILWRQALGGRCFPVRETMSSITWRGRPARLIAVHDISGDIARRASLDRIARQDPLTGLPNRQVLPETIRMRLARARREGTMLAVCFLDLDGFKSVNDSLGHEAGDAVLRGVADRIKEQLRAADTIVRLGGDEFVLLIGDFVSLNEFERILERILTSIAEPFGLGDVTVTVTASAGVALHPSDGDDGDALLRSADRAMYRAKSTGGHGIAYSNSSYERRLQARTELLERVVQALETDELGVHYQPIVSLVDGAVESFEAMLRWQHPVLGTLPAADFLPLVSDGRTKLRIDRLVLDRVRRDLERWGLDAPHSVRFNLFATDDHLDALAGLLDSLAHAAPRTCLTAEVALPERGDPVTALAGVATVCHAANVRLCLDGLVTGHDSIHLLTSIDVDEFKLAHELLALDPDGVDPDHPDRARHARAYLALADSLHRPVVVKRVNTREQARRLAEVGYRSVQGRAFSAAVPATDVPALSQRRFDPPRAD